MLRIIVFIVALFAQTSLGLAQGIIRDAEIEAGLKRLAKPILQSAGLSTASVTIYVINARSLNAFVTPGNNIFVHLGLIQRLGTAEQLQAVLAHEIAHITGNHYAKRIGDIGAARTAAALGTILGVAATVAGAGEAGIGIAAGAGSAANRSLLANTRSQESTADQIAVRYLARAGIDPKAAIETLEIFAGQDLLTARRRDPYALTHPLSRERISALRAVIAATPIRKTDVNANADYYYQRIRAKIAGFSNAPSETLRRYKNHPSVEIGALARAVANHRKPNKSAAIRELNTLLKLRPNDPYYWELRGQIQLESGDSKGAVAAYRQASRLAPKEALILAGLGRALNAQAGNAPSKEALQVLERAYARDPRDPRMLRDYAVVLAKSGQTGQASLVTAERYAIGGNLAQAAIHAKRAQGLLTPGSAGYLRADDIIRAAQRQKRLK